MGVITFKGVASDTLGIVVENPPDYKAPEKDYDSYHVPGKSGDIFVDHGSYKNTTVSYNIALGSYTADFQDLTKTVTDWLFSSNKYEILTDSFDSKYYRYGFYKGSTEVANVLWTAGRATIEFDCKPFRYLVSGTTPSSDISSETTITNPTSYAAKPKIEIVLKVASTGGTVTWGNKTITISDDTEATTFIIDSDLQDCYYDTVNLNPYVSFSGDGEFPEIPPSGVTITVSEEIDHVKILDYRWYVI
jgi:predicted phage tail component-like protein